MAGGNMTERLTTVTRKGQVTVPQEIRRALGLKEGDKVAFVWEGQEVKLKPAGSVVERTAGIFSRYRKEPPPSADEERAAFEQAVAEQVVESMEG